jgi:tyrosine-protein kinase Etk/Wzc
MTPTVPSPEGPPDKEINLLDLLGVIWVRKFWIAAAVVVALAIGAIMVLKAQQIYQARGLLKIEMSSGSSALPANMLGSGFGDNSAKAEIEIMKSRLVMTQAVYELDFQIYVYPRPLPFLGLIPMRLNLPDPGFGALIPYQWGNETIQLGELEVPQDWLGTSMTLTITGVGEYRITLPDGSTADGIVRERLALPEQSFSLVVDELKGPSGREFFFGRMKVPVAVSKLQRGFSVQEAPTGSSILQVSYVGPDPRRAEAALDAIARSYLDQNIARSAAEAQNSLTFIEGQLPIAEESVIESQNALNAYRQEQQSVDVNYETQTLLQQSTQIEAQLNDLSLQENGLKERYTINHPVYQALLQKRVLLEKQLEKVREATLLLPETQKEIFNLTRNLEVAQQVYVQLLNRGQELRVVRASTVGSVRIIDAAYSNGARIAPRTTRTLMMYLLVGLLVGVGGVLLRHALHRGIRSAQEIEQIGLPVFATVGFSPSSDNLKKRKGMLPILAMSSPNDLVIEGLRSLRTSLHFGMLDAKTNIVLLTSATPDAGKSFISINLAVVAAQAGQRVCVVDADMRRGYLWRYLGKKNDTPGLAEIIAQEKTLDEVLVPGPVEGMSVVLSGRYPPNPSELLMRADFDTLLKTLDQHFDLIIVDSPPALAVTDPVVIGRYTGATIIIARHMETMIGEVDAVRGIFERAGIKVTGAILNSYKVSEGNKYGGQYQYYNYRYDYKTERS